MPELLPHPHHRLACARLGCATLRRAPEKSAVQRLALAYWSFHYAKRILETFLVHK